VLQPWMVTKDKAIINIPKNFIIFSF